LLMQIEGLMKIGIATKDLEKTVSVLKDALGLEAGEAVSVEPSGMRFRLFKLGDFYIEVMEPLGPDGPIATFIERHGEGLQHMTFKVRDVERTMADLKAKGARFTSSAPVRLNSVLGPMKFVFMNPRMSNGVLIQLMELL
jgi:methylmalonyl-CoA/ethylmalonyl-CoA epimerase